MTILKWVTILLFTLLILFSLLLALINWNWARDQALQQVGELTGRTLTIEGDLDIEWSLVPRVRMTQIRLENADWSDKPYMLELAVLDFRVDLRKLITGQLLFPEITLIKPVVLLEKSTEGEVNWQFETDPVTETVTPDDRTEFPIIKRFHIKEGSVVYLDPATDTDITATFASLTGKGGDKESVILQAQGKVAGKILKVALKSDSLTALQTAGRPYHVALIAQLDDTFLKADGTLLEPLKLENIDLHLEIEGPNPGQLSTALGFPFPDLPPFRLAGDLSRKEVVWKMQNFDALVGDSDLTGDLHIDTRNDPLFIQADLTSQKLDLDDLGPLIGIAPDTGAGETASPEQKKEAKLEEASIHILPRDIIDFKALQQIDAEINLRAKRIESILPLDDLSMRMVVENGHLKLAPLDFGVASGSVRSSVELDTGKKPVTSKIETELRRVRLFEILQHIEIADDNAGLIGGRGVFWFAGDSIAEMMATADGGMLMLMTGGQFDDLIVELAGLDIGESIAALIGDDKDIGINCAFVDLPTENGVMTVDTLVVDSKDTVFLGAGTIDFTTEQLDLVIDPKPKDISLFSARAPLHIEGKFGAPDFTPGASSILRGAASLAMLPSAPIASLVALLEEEEENQENIHCSGFVEAINDAR
jgi:AsmA family protein